MRKLLLLATFFVVGLTSVKSQDLSFTCPRDTILACGNPCLDIVANIPDIRSLASDYTISNISTLTQCYPLIDPGTAGPAANDSIDDRYSAVINLPFTFPFYGTNYNSLVISTNGYLSFDATRADLFSHYADNGNLPNTSYDRALIMGPYHDLEPDTDVSPTQRIKYNTVGAAPNRKWVLSFYRVPLFSCDDLIENTHQIILYESSGVIEVFIQDKQICIDWEDGKAMVGLQNFARNLGIMAPSRRESDPPWGSIGMNETWRFIPKNGPTTYVRTELLDGAGTVVATGDTTRTSANSFRVSFPNVCPPANTTTTYVVKTTYNHIINTGTTYYSLDTLFVTRQNSLPLDTTTTQTECGGATGSITVSASGGTPPYEYSINYGPYQSSGTFTGLAQGIYNIVGRDATLCTDTLQVPITSLANIPGTATTMATGCPGVNNGSITVTPGGGTGPYTYSLDGGASGSSNVITGVSAGAHTVVFTDANGCTGAVTVTVGQGNSITSSPPQTTQATCSGANNGSITITPTSGSAPYTYSLNGGPQQSSNIFSNLAGGSYSIQIRDAAGCTGTRTTFVGTGSGITVPTPTHTPESCPGAANGTITVTPTNGTAPFTYSLDGGTPQSSNIFTGVRGGLRSVLVTDANNCTRTVTVPVSTGTGITASATTQPTACSGAANGSITVTVNPPTGAYTYQLNTGTPQASNIFNGVADGPHYVVVRAGACVDTVDVTVAPGTNLNGSAVSDASSCGTAADGSITVTVLNGTAPFTYSLNGTTFQPSNVFNGLLTGAYTVTFRDASGCEGETDVTVDAGTGISGTSSTSPTSCDGVNNGSITITPTAGLGQAPFSYSLDGGTSQASNIFNGVSSGAHVVIITDALGCTGTVNATVGVGTSFSGAAATTNASCAGVNNGSVIITPDASAVAPYSFSLNGGPGQPSGTFNSLSAGAHIVVITDNNGCTAPVNFTIGTNAGITGQVINQAPASCAGVNDGSVTLEAGATATAPVTFSMDGGPSQASPTFLGLSAGAHVAIVTDANGCTAPINFTVTAGGLLAGSYTEVKATCPTASNGSITVVPTVSGTGPYSFSLDGGAPQGSGTFAGLAPGNYTVVFTNGAGCLSEEISATVTSAAALTLNATTAATSCPGVNNGSVTLSPDAAAVAPLTFTLDGGTPQPSPVFTGLAAGPHTATMTDANGCPATFTFNIGSGTQITGQATSLIAASCPGVNDGGVTITPGANATAPFTFTMDGGVPQASPVFTGLSAGAHVATIRDANGCEGPVNFTITAGGLLDGSFTQVSATCPDASNGSITVIPTVTGTGPYLYSLDGGTPQSSAIFNNLSAGTYTATFTNGAGCLSESISAVVTAAPALTLSATAEDASCPGVSNGSVTLVADTDAVAPITYSVDGGTPQSSAIFNGLAAGSHTATMMDANGCPATVTFTIGSGADLSATTESRETSCPGVNNGSITVTPTRGTAPYQFSIDGGTPQASPTFNNLAPGSYSITFTDAIGCRGTVSASVGQGISIDSDVTPSQPVCNGINDGEITVTPTSGVGPYTFSINAGLPQASPTFTGLAPGTYNILVTDGVGCTGTNSTTLTTNPAIAILLAKEDPTCFGTTDGSVTITTAGGVSPYEYSIDGGATFQSSSTFNGLGNGAYSIRVRDNAGCLKDTSENLVQPALLTANASATPSTCQGGDGTITVNAAGGTPDYLYSVDNGATYPFQSSNVFTVAKGSYTEVAVKDANGCVETVSTIVGEIDVMGPLFIGNDTTVCQGQPVTFRPEVHPQATIFKWRENIYLDSDTIRNATATPEDTTMYILTAQWGACQREDTITVNVLLRPIPDAGPDQRICLNDSTTISGTVSHTSGPVTLVWSPANLVHDDSSATTIAVPGGTQVYTLIATDDYGCNFSVTDSVLIAMQPTVPAYAGGDTLVTVNLPFQLAGSGGVQYMWSTNSTVATIADPTVQRPTITSTGDANFMVRVTDIAGCVGLDTVYVQVYQGPEYYVPNAFTPNGDGLNDVFRAIPVGMTRPEYFRIFNRYGELVFETNQYLKGWDGTFKGKLQPMGSYIWILKGEDRKGRKVEMRGTVMLVQ